MPKFPSRVKDLLQALDLKSHNPITLLIDSEGGSMIYSLELCGFLSSMIHSPVTGLVSGRCYSAAIPILQSCKIRTATLRSIFFIHPSKLVEEDIVERHNLWVDDELVTSLLALAYVAQRNLSHSREIIARRSGKSLDEIRQWELQGRQQYYFRAPEAQDRGLLDEIIEKQER